VGGAVGTGGRTPDASIGTGGTTSTDCATADAGTDGSARTECGACLGVCVPPASVTDADLKAALNAVDDPTGKPGTGCTQKDASGAFYLCAPKLKARDQSAQFPVCTPTSIGALLALANMAGQKGGCVPAYIVPSGSQTLVAQDTCVTGEKCWTCTNPLSTPTGNMPSGACPWP
jgi:hypothetical protein